MSENNLFQNIPAELQAEIVECLLQTKGLRIERILSKGHCSPPDFWYDQEQSEWVLLVQGEAKLRFRGQADSVHLKAGAYLNIPAHAQHRVEWTSSREECIWLAVFY